MNLAPFDFVDQWFFRGPLKAKGLRFGPQDMEREGVRADFRQGHRTVTIRYAVQRLSATCVAGHKFRIFAGYLLCW